MARLTSARRLRKEVLEEWDLSPVEVRILDDMCHEAELISRMAKELDGGDLLTVDRSDAPQPPARGDQTAPGSDGIPREGLAPAG